jgi:hypothetical protein
LEWFPTTRRNGLYPRVDAAGKLVGSLAKEDERFHTLLRRFGVTGEYVGYGGRAVFTLARVSEDGTRIWPEGKGGH